MTDSTRAELILANLAIAVVFAVSLVLMGSFYHHVKHCVVVERDSTASCLYREVMEQ